MKSNVLLFLFSFLFLTSCQEQKKNLCSSDSYLVEVSILSDIYRGIAEYLSLSKLVRLEDEPLVAPIKDIEIVDDRIIILDITSRILCYDMEGKVQFVIDAKGNGPGEYASVGFFSVDEEERKIWIYDKSQAILFGYSLINGKFVEKRNQRKPMPFDIAYENGMCYFDNPYHRNYREDVDLHYSLLSFRDRMTIEKRFFQHDEAEHEYNFIVSEKSFYRSNELLYCKNFSKEVYALNGSDVSLRYEFVIPDWLGHEQIERKMDIGALLKSEYSYGLCDIFECDDVLAFRFSKCGFIYSAMYDLKKNEQIYCSRIVQGQDGSRVPLINAIVGAYESQFVSVLSPEFLDYQKKKNPDMIESLIPNYNPDESNPIIAFYDVVRPME